MAQVGYPNPKLPGPTLPNMSLISDIDEKSLQSARENVERNEGKLGHRIAIFESTPDGPFFPLDKFGIDRLDFSMCNPPFYESVEEMFASAQSKQLPPSSVSPLGSSKFQSR